MITNIFGKIAANKHLSIISDIGLLEKVDAIPNCKVGRKLTASNDFVFEKDPEEKKRLLISYLLLCAKAVMHDLGIDYDTIPDNLIFYFFSESDFLDISFCCLAREE